jgi:hypothetical protein
MYSRRKHNIIILMQIFMGKLLPHFFRNRHACGLLYESPKKCSCKHDYRSSVLCSVKMVTTNLTRARLVNIIITLSRLKLTWHIYCVHSYFMIFIDRCEFKRIYI